MQSLRAVQRIGSSTAVLGRTTAIRARATSNIAGGSMGKAWADKEHAAENQYFNKKDAEVLAQLADKLKNHTAPTTESIAQAKTDLLEIFAKHDTKPSDALLDEIVKFKFNH